MMDHICIKLKMVPYLSLIHRMQCTLEEAYSKARYDWMRDALATWIKRKGFQNVSLRVHDGDCINNNDSATTGITSSPLISSQPETPGITMET